MPVTTVTRRYHFEAGHFLPKVRDGHRCKRQHGHNYEIEVTVGGSIGNDGFIMDFWDLDEVVMPLVNQLDHRNLNDIEGLENPTAEIIAVWFLDRLHDVDAVSVTVWETKDCYAKVTR